MTTAINQYHIDQFNSYYKLAYLNGGISTHANFIFKKNESWPDYLKKLCAGDYIALNLDPAAISDLEINDVNISFSMSVKGVAYHVVLKYSDMYMVFINLKDNKCIEIPFVFIDYGVEEPPVERAATNNIVTFPTRGKK